MESNDYQVFTNLFEIFKEEPKDGHEEGNIERK